jgi:hypothetical protein
MLVEGMLIPVEHQFDIPNEWGHPLRAVLKYFVGKHDKAIHVTLIAGIDLLYADHMMTSY